VNGRFATTVFAGVAAAAGALLGGCTKSEDPAPRTALVFAAASLAVPFQALATAFEAGHAGMRVELDFEGTPQLVMKVVQQGAPADVFASADVANMQRVVQAGKTAGAPREFARNRLAIVVGKGNPKAVRGLADLARADLRVVLCGPEVPAGKYARQALAKAAVTVRSRSDEPSVKAVVAKVQLGEVDAGIVYVTDVSAAGAAVAAVSIPDEHNVAVSYPISVLSAGSNRVIGERFVAFVLSDAGREILQRAGFQLP
jgi:molybdate transport system substrate-binding protein